MSDRRDNIQRIYRVLTSRGCQLAAIVPLLVAYILYSGSYGLWIGTPLLAMYTLLHFRRLALVDALERLLRRQKSLIIGLLMPAFAVILGISVGLLVSQLLPTATYILFDALSARVLSLVMGAVVALGSLSRLISYTLECQYRATLFSDMILAESLLLLKVYAITTAVMVDWVR